jgi:hypothetical protein
MVWCNVVTCIIGVTPMSTPAYKKRARQAQHKADKRKRKYEELFKVNKPVKQEFRPYVPPEIFTRQSNADAIPTSDSISSNGSTARVEPKVYTGDYIVGIATMHKSNLVPVGRGTDPKDFATMRRN